MKLEVPKRKIQDIVSKTEKITGKNVTLPVLKCLYFEVKNKKLTVKATNLDMGIEMYIPVSAEDEGVMAVPGSVLNSFISSLPDDSTITIQSQNDNLKISTSSSSTVIKTMPVDDFPNIPPVENGEIFTIDSSKFIEGLKSVWFAAAVSSMKPELSSVYVYTDKNEIVFAATDSFRIAEKRIQAKISHDFGHILLPVKNIPDIIRILESATGDIEVNLNKNQLSISYENVYMVSRVIDGVFPDYHQIIPKGFKTEVTVLKQDLINSLKVANIFSGKFNQISVHVSPSSKIFEIATKNADVGESVTKVESSSTGEDLDINVAYKYFSESFQSIDSDTLSIQFNGLGKPVMVRGVSDKTFLYIMMPMNK